MSLEFRCLGLKISLSVIDDCSDKFVFDQGSPFFFDGQIGIEIVWI